MDLTTFERYHELLDDPEAFTRAAARPLPICVWANTRRTTPERLRFWMEAGGFSPQPIPWYPGAFRLGPEVRPGNRLEFVTGLYHVQEEVSLLPPVLLDVRPGQRVLDLCAAPGNKTAQIALVVGETGTVVANDRHFSRLAILRRNVDRLGLANCVTTIFDATSYPKASGLFDRVLADVPCSCEGTSRKFRDIATSAQVGRLARLQTAILRRAVQLTRPGGRIVYATCTYAPEENEAVVAAILEEFGPGVLSLAPARVPGFAGAEGLTAWQGQHFPEDLRLTLRAWPHLSDSGGFFVAVLEKTAASPEDAPDVWDPVLGIADRESWLGPLRDRFGLPPEVFEPYELLEPGAKHLAMATASLKLPRRPELHSVGIPLVRTDMAAPKLATGASFLLGAAASRSVLAVDQEQADAYVQRRPFEVSPEQAAMAEGPGYVLLRHEEVILGVGRLVLGDPADGAAAGRVESYFPKAWGLAKERSLFRPD